MEAIQEALLMTLSGILVAAIGVIGESVRKWLNAKFNKEQLQQGVEITRIAVNAIEQISDQVNGHAKFLSAKTKVIEALKEKKIKISEDQIDLLIESAVSEMNKQIEIGKREIVQPTSDDAYIPIKASHLYVRPALDGEIRVTKTE